ncbi:MAG: hypothetical protein R2707_11120 [Acidimicrobiales bacterium]
MRDRIGELGEEAIVALVTFTDGESLRDYEARHELGFVALRDPDREGYRAFGLGRGSVSRVWGLRSARRYAQLIRRNGIGGLRRPTEDPLQLGGDFVIGPDGRLVWGFWSDGPDHRPAFGDLAAAVRDARRP